LFKHTIGNSITLFDLFVNDREGFFRSICKITSASTPKALKLDKGCRVWYNVGIDPKTIPDYHANNLYLIGRGWRLDNPRTQGD
jgi:hypothetical protein